MARPQVGSLPATPEPVTSGDAGSPGTAGENAALSGHRHPAQGLVSRGLLAAHERDGAAHRWVHDHGKADEGGDYIYPERIGLESGLPTHLYSDASGLVVAVYPYILEPAGGEPAGNYHRPTPPPTWHLGVDTLRPAAADSTYSPGGYVGSDGHRVRVYVKGIDGMVDADVPASIARDAEVQAGYLPVTLGTELVTNGGFNSNLTGWTVSDATSSLWSSFLGVGAEGGLCTVGDGTGSEEVTQDVTVTPGRMYRLAAQLWCASASARVSIEWRTATGSLGSTTVLDNGTTLSSWASVLGNFIAPAGAVIARVTLAIPSGSTADARFDNVSLKEISVVVGALAAGEVSAPRVNSPATNLFLWGNCS